MPKVLIVGINSFLGIAIYKKLIDFHEVVGVYHVNSDKIPTDIKVLSLNELINNEPETYEYIFIVSAFVSKEDNMENDVKLFEANVLLPNKIINLFSNARVVYCSSVSVYEGANYIDIIDEDTRPSPVSHYALSKLWGEKVVSKSKSFAIIRISSMFGVGMNENTFLPMIINQALQNGTINLAGDGNRSQNYIHVDDVAELAIKAACSSLNRVFLTTNRRSYSNVEIAEIIKELVGCQIDFGGIDNSKSFFYKNDQTVEYLNKEVFINIKDGIREFIEWKRK